MKSRNILIVSPICPIPEDANGTSVIVHNIAKTLAVSDNVKVLYYQHGQRHVAFDHQMPYGLEGMSLKSKCSNVFLNFVIPRNSHWTIGKELVVSDEVHYDIIIVFRLDTGFFLKNIIGRVKYSKIIFYPIDLLSTLYRSLRRMENSYIMRLYYYYQEVLVRYWEDRFLRVADLNVFVSTRDSDIARKLFKNLNNIHGFRNGIEQYEGSYSIGDLCQPYKIGFSGDYSYKPNRDAAHFIINKIAPAVKRFNMSFEFYLIGRCPDDPMIHSKSDGNVKFYITSEVDCIDDWLEKLDIFICPLFSGAGMKNKILKALSIGLPIISTKHGVEGINELVKGESYIECDTNDAQLWASNITTLLENKSVRSMMSVKGKKIVMQRYSWESVVKDILCSLEYCQSNN